MLIICGTCTRHPYLFVLSIKKERVQQIHNHLMARTEVWKTNKWWISIRLDLIIQKGSCKQTNKQTKHIIYVYIFFIYTYLLWCELTLFPHSTFGHPHHDNIRKPNHCMHRLRMPYSNFVLKWYCYISLHIDISWVGCLKMSLHSTMWVACVLLQSIYFHKFKLKNDRNYETRTYWYNDNP